MSFQAHSHLKRRHCNNVILFLLVKGINRVTQRFHKGKSYNKSLEH